MTLAKQFFFAGGIVTVGAVMLVSLSVTSLITQAVTRNAAAATALYVDSIIAPILPDLSATQEMDSSVERALDETLSHGALGRRLLSFRLWRDDGKIIYSNDKTLMGRLVPPSKDRQLAFRGELVANYEKTDEDDSPSERESGGPLLEIYNPVLQPWSGEVVAVAEFYEDAANVEASLTRALLLTWLSILSVLALFFLLLSLIVFRGSAIIETQRKALKEQIADLDKLLRQNTELGKRVQKASQQTAAINEQFLRKVGADIHDGPVQLLAYATMRVDSPAIRIGAGPEAGRHQEVDLIKRSLEDAIQELRAICRGLVLPEIENLPIEQVMDHVVSSFRSRTGADVMLVTQPTSCPISTSTRICAYRFVQEGLNNGWLHAQGKGQFVEQRIADDMLMITVGDEGPGFDPATIGSGRLGLSGMRERIESIGGRFNILTSSSGTRLTMLLTVSETSAV